MKRALRLGFCLLASVAAGAEVRQTFPVDLDGDGKTEQVQLRTYTMSGTRYGQLAVLRGGKPVWQGPRARTQEQAYRDPYVLLGEFDLGDISFVGDYDGDGRVDLVATRQKSDVRPTVFSQFVWTGKKFAFVRQLCLLPLPGEPQRFGWKPAGKTDPLWVDQLRRNLDGSFGAELVDFASGERSHVRLKWADGAFSVAR